VRRVITFVLNVFQGRHSVPTNTTFGTSGDDILSGGNGTDTIYGGDGNDIISGGNGIDNLFGEGGNDQLTGDNGADHLTGGADDDTLDGSLGFDTAYYSGNIEEYSFFNAAGYLHVVHAGGAGADGHDKVVNVERLVFADRVVDIGSGKNRPVAGDDHVFITEDTGTHSSGAGSVLNNDFDFDGDALTVTGGTFTGTYGTLTLNADGTYSYTLFASVQGLDDGEVVTDSFNYTVTDNDGSDTGALVFHIAGLNDAPVANDDAAATTEDAAVSGNVLANDTDIDVETLAVANPGTYVGANGTLVLAADGNYTYTPNAGAQGLDDGESVQDVFNYTATDGTASDTATLTVTVNGVNDAPIANDDTAAATEETGTSGNVLTNDTDVDGETVTVTNPGTYVGTYGTLTLAADGSYTYAPGAAAQGLDTGEIGADAFVYTASDGTASDNGTLTVNVAGLNDAPVANDDTNATDEITPVSGNVLANDTDVDGETLTVANPGTFIGAYGTLVLASNGSYTYTPGGAAALLDAGETANDVFNYVASDGTVTDAATLTITVSGLSGVTNAVDDTATTTEDANVSGNVLTNDTDDEGDPLTVSNPGVYAGTYGTLTLAADGSYTYAPGAAADGIAVGETADDVFSYTATDGTNSDTASLTVTLTGLNDAPTIDAGGTDADGAVTELPDGDPGEGTTVHTDSGAVAFDDVDISDTHSASFTPQGGGYFGTFTLDPVDQTGDSVGWDFSVSDAQLEGLSEGQIVTQVYTVEVDDGNGGTASQDVTITITGAGVGTGPQTVWFIDNSAVGSANTGTSADPYTSLAAFNAAQGTLGGPQVGHQVYLRAGTGTYAEADGINLLNGQTLTGVADGPLRPTIEATAGDGINVAQNNSVSGLDVGNTSGADIADSGGTVGTLTISDVGTSGTGQVIDVDQGGTLNVTLNSAESLGSSGGAVDLAGVGGSFTVTGATTITGVHSGGGIDVTGSSVAASFAGGGTVATLGTSAVNYVGNTGSLELGGGLDIVTTSGSGLNATGGGTVTVTGAGNSATSTIGVAVTISGTTIGAAAVTFESVSANGAASGIVLANTGALGGFSVTGTGVAASGGTIQNTTGVGVSLTNTANVSLDSMVIANTGSHGVAGTGVTDASGGTVASFAFSNGLLDSVGDGDNESALFFDTAGVTNITGRLVVSNTTIQNFEEVGIHVGNIGGTLVIDVTDTVFNNNSDLHGEEGIDVDASGTANITLNVTGTPTGLPSSALFTSTTRFTDLDGGAINAVANGSGVLEVNVDSVLITGTGGPDNFPTPPAITLTAEGTSSSLTFDIFGNRMDDLSGDGIVVGQEGTLEGRIAENTITNTQVGDGIRIDTGSTGGNTATILIQDNVITNIGDDGIQVLHPDGPKTLNLTIDGNTIQNTASEGIRVFADDDVLGGGPLTRLQITDNVFGSNGTGDGTDSVFIFSQDPGTEIFAEINGNSGMEGLTVRQALSAFLSIEQADLPALSADNGGAFVTGLGTITFNTLVSVPQPDNWL
jgi:VCBS repeat-containing protein